MGAALSGVKGSAEVKEHDEDIVESKLAKEKVRNSLSAPFARWRWGNDTFSFNSTLSDLKM